MSMRRNITQRIAGIICAMTQSRTAALTAVALLALPMLLVSCARMGSPDGGWYDETPPRVVAASPAERETEVKERKMRIYFNEFIKIENASEKVVVSPPQKEMPEIRPKGKYIEISLLDSLKPNTTYTIDFSDAISDNNEGNPLGNYTYSFSTGTTIDTLEVSGTVLNAEDLEPVKGILVGLYELPDSGDTTMEEMSRHDSIAAPAFIRVSRTDSRGRFVIRGVAPGSYNIGALQDMDGNYSFNTLSEVMAFSEDVITPSVFVDTRQDTVWADELHIKDIHRIKYNHYLPDNIILRSFSHVIADRYYLKAERNEADRFTLFFTAPVPNDTTAFKRLGMDYATSRLPWIKGLNFDERDAFVVEPSLKGDTVTYWLRDTMLVNQDTLRMEMRTLATDTLGMLSMTTDTLEILAKTPYEKRMKAKAKEIEAWQKKLEKRRKRLEEGEVLTDTLMPVKRLKPNYNIPQALNPDGTLYVTFPAPLSKVNKEAVHLYVMQDSMWYRAPFVFTPVTREGEIIRDSLPRKWQIVSEWIPGAEYSVEIDTLAFEDVYGNTSDPYKSGMMVRKLDEYGSLFVNVTYNDNAAAATKKREVKPVILVQLMETGDKPVRTEPVVNGTAEFYYLNAGKYYMRAIVDRNANGVWDTGDYLTGTQPEEVYYYNDAIECKAKWDLTKAWNLTALPLNRQKPAAITRQKADAEKKVQNRNAKRAADKGIQAPQQ